MRRRSLGKTGVSVSEIGIGTWGMGSMWGARDDDAALAALRLAVESGVTFIDTEAEAFHLHALTSGGQGERTEQD